MSLSHVLMWTDGYGYRAVTEVEAAQIYPKTVSACSETFVCGICGQAVTFTAGDVKARHFRHSSAEENKNCEDRSRQYEQDRDSWAFRKELRTLPLRLIRTVEPYRLELGLLTLPEEQLVQYRGQTLRIAGQGAKEFLYDLEERLQADRLTWLDVGNVPAKLYQLSSTTEKALPTLWPRRVDGVDDITLFDAETGKRLPPCPYVEVDRGYIVAIRNKRDLINEWSADVSCLPIVEHGWGGWRLYRIKALRLSKSAFFFFLQFQAILTERAPSIFPLWPAFVRTPHLIYHNADELFIFIEGAGTQVHLFPRPASPLPNPRNERAHIVRFEAGSRKQMVTSSSAEQLLKVGHSHMLRYDYFIRRELNQTASRPEVMVTDRRGTILQKDLVEGIPLKGAIRISAPFDGEVWLESDGFLFDRRVLKGGKDLDLKVKVGLTLTIFQGLDRIRSIVFARPGQKKPEEGHGKASWDDALLFRRLRRMTGDEVSAGHTLAEAARFFRKYRATSAWLRVRKAEGQISARALALLRELMEKMTI